MEKYFLPKNITGFKLLLSLLLLGKQEISHFLVVGLNLNSLSRRMIQIRGEVEGRDRVQADTKAGSQGS